MVVELSNNWKYCWEAKYKPQLTLIAQIDGFSCPLHKIKLSLLIHFLHSLLWSCFSRAGWEREMKCEIVWLNDFPLIMIGIWIHTNVFCPFGWIPCRNQWITFSWGDGWKMRQWVWPQLPSCDLSVSLLTVWVYFMYTTKSTKPIAWLCQFHCVCKNTITYLLYYVLGISEKWEKTYTCSRWTGGGGRISPLQRCQSPRT